MRFSLRLNNDLAVAEYVAIAQAAEASGFDQRIATLSVKRSARCCFGSSERPRLLGIGPPQYRAEDDS